MFYFYLSLIDPPHAALRASTNPFFRHQSSRLVLILDIIHCQSSLLNQFSVQSSSAYLSNKIDLITFFLILYCTKLHEVKP
jgi:hypothetical protein